jgi:hypothetical protein
MAEDKAPIPPPGGEGQAASAAKGGGRVLRRFSHLPPSLRGFAAFPAPPGVGMALVLAAIALLAPTPAFACSCMRIAPEGFRLQAAAIIEGRVTGVKREGGVNGRLIARIAVARIVKGQTPRTVTVTTRGNSAACGVGFHPGQTGEFLLSRDNGRYATNLCMMLGARR